MESKHSRLSYIILIIATIGNLYLWLAHIQETTDYGEYFSYISFLEFIFCVFGLFALDPLYSRGFHFKPDQYEPILEGNKLFRIGLTVGFLIVIQMIAKYMPLTVKDWEVALSVQFAGAGEECFFRAFIIGIFIRFTKDNQRFNLGLIRISPFELIGVILSSILFGTIHVNYWNDPTLLGGTIFCGLWLGFVWVKWQDLSTNILSHFILNFLAQITLYQKFWSLIFS